MTNCFKTIFLTVFITLFSFTFVNAKTVIRTDEAAIGEADPAKFSDNIDSIIMFNTYDALVDEVKNGGEDFSYFANKVPGCFFFLGSAPRDRAPMSTPQQDRKSTV